MAIAEGKKPVILLVEDDPIVRMDMADTLHRRGFRVLRVGSAEHAARIIRKPDICAVITDMRLPGSMSGLDLIRAVAEQRPECGLILLSGMSSPSTMEMPPGTVFLSKPVRETELDDALAMLGLAEAQDPA